MLSAWRSCWQMKVGSQVILHTPTIYLRDRGGGGWHEEEEGEEQSRDLMGNTRSGCTVLGVRSALLGEVVPEKRIHREGEPAGLFQCLFDSFFSNPCSVYLY